MVHELSVPGMGSPLSTPRSSAAPAGPLTVASQRLQAPGFLPDLQGRAHPRSRADHFPLLLQVRHYLPNLQNDGRAGYGGVGRVLVLHVEILRVLPYMMVHTHSVSS